MTIMFWVFGSAQFLWSILPSDLTGGWLRLGHEMGYIADALAQMTGLLCIGIGCILHQLVAKK